MIYLLPQHCELVLDFCGIRDIVGMDTNFVWIELGWIEKSPRELFTRGVKLACHDGGEICAGLIRHGILMIMKMTMESRKRGSIFERGGGGVDALLFLIWIIVF